MCLKFVHSENRIQMDKKDCLQPLPLIHSKVVASKTQEGTLSDLITF